MKTCYITSSGNWRPTKHFFFQSDRASQIRNLCIQVMQRVNALFTNPAIQNDDKRKVEIYCQLEALNGRLIALGIISNMHQEKPEEERGRKMKNDPNMLAEFLASQLITYTGSEISRESDLTCIAQEFSEKKITDDNGITSHFILNKSPKPQMYMKTLQIRGIINWIDIMMDTEGKVFEDIT